MANTALQLRLSALNSTKTGFASFEFEKDVFFEEYSFSARGDSHSGSVSLDRFFCQIYIKVRPVACALSMVIEMFSLC